MILDLAEIRLKIRKPFAPKEKIFRDKKKYNRQVVKKGNTFRD